MGSCAQTSRAQDPAGVRHRGPLIAGAGYADSRVPGWRMGRLRRSAHLKRTSSHQFKAESRRGSVWWTPAPTEPTGRRRLEAPAAPRRTPNTPTHRVTRAADDDPPRAATASAVTVSSGASPSGPVHLGNLREFLTVHFVAEECAAAGARATPPRVGRLRPVPEGPRRRRPVVGRHIGRPLSRSPTRGPATVVGRALQGSAPRRPPRLGVQMEEITQTQRYTAGPYREQVLPAAGTR